MRKDIFQEYMCPQPTREARKMVDDAAVQAVIQELRHHIAHFETNAQIKMMQSRAPEGTRFSLLENGQVRIAQVISYSVQWSDTDSFVFVRLKIEPNEYRTYTLDQFRSMFAL